MSDQHNVPTDARLFVIREMCLEYALEHGRGESGQDQLSLLGRAVPELFQKIDAQAKHITDSNRAALTMEKRLKEVFDELKAAKAALEEKNEQLRTLYTECIICKCVLLHPETPPKCETCAHSGKDETEEDLDKWHETRAELSK